jgi:hypothetical protein
MAVGRRKRLPHKSPTVVLNIVIVGFFAAVTGRLEADALRKAL